MLHQFNSIEPELLITAAAGLVAFLTVFVIWQTLLQRNPLAARARSLGRHRDKLRSGRLKAKPNRFQRVETMSLMRKVIVRLDLLKGAHVTKVTEQLIQAGWRSQDAVVVFLFMKLSLPFVLGGVTALFIYGFGVVEASSMIKLLYAMAGVVVGAYLPAIVLAHVVKKRRLQIQRGLPDVLDLLVICAESGLALDAALTRVAREMSRSAPELADELSLTAIELGFQPDRRTALKNLIKRTEMASIRGVVNTLMQTEKYGTPLAQSLRVLASEYRDERMLKAEAKAAKLPATLTIPLITFILPSLFIVLLGPAILSAVDGLGGLSF